MRVIDRFMKYVTYDTQSSETSGTHPSSPKEKVFAAVLADELRGLGAKDVYLSEDAYVYATVPASAGWTGGKPLGLLAHLDTSSAASGANVKPRRVRYEGGVLPLGTSGRALDPAVFPELRGLAGKELVVTDGTTLLGGDDKLGVAILMTLAEELLAANAPRHREIRICFTPDEEIGEGTRGFDVARFGAKRAFTVDGGAPNTVVTANFNAARAEYRVTGVSVHPGSAKNKMVSAIKVATEILDALPAEECPEKTAGREGFFHVTELKGGVSSATLKLIVRDHNAAHFEVRKRTLRTIAEEVRKRHPRAVVELEVADQYRNMEEKLAEVPELVESAKAAIRSVGLEPHLSACRGGTDGANLSQMGIPCPDLGTGGHNCHGECEFAVVEEVEQALRIVRYLAGAEA